MESYEKPNDKDRKEDRSPLLTPKEAARYLKVSKVTVYRLASEGVFPSAKLHGRGSLRILKTDLENYINQKRAESGNSE